MEAGSKARVVIDLEKESERCGGVVAAILTHIRRLNRGDILVIVNTSSKASELRQVLEMFKDYGVLRILEDKGDKVIVAKAS
ncbi:MAG: hypothetical protein F7C07_00010 [Desulfurococcales archaeon]|nr:hypothetical protein [Desulfurococcales archaeon]